MRYVVQLCALLLFASYSSAASHERVWLSTSTPPTVSTTTPTIPSAVTEDVTDVSSAPVGRVEDEPQKTTPDILQVIPTEGVADPEDQDEHSEQADNSVRIPEQSVLNEEATENGDEDEVKVNPRVWMSVLPSDDTENQVQQVSNNSSEKSSDIVTGEHVQNESQVEILGNNTKLGDTGENDTTVILETILSKSIFFMTFTEPWESPEPVFVNLTGIRDFTGTERRIVSGCLDLSDLYITGEEVKEVILRMAKYNFHRLDLSNNNIIEFPPKTFSSIAFSLRELRLNGNPLRSNSLEEGSVLQRGGLFHLSELRDLNMSNCELLDMDFFTPWNSNRLEVVDLSNNRLHFVPSNLQFFHRLKILYLDGNPITHITEIPFALLWNLQALSVSGCMVSSITSDPFRNMDHLKELSLQGNNLTRIEGLRLARSSSGANLYLSGNPWHCGCAMLNFIEHHYYSIRDVDDIRCDSPRWLQGLRTAYLTKEILSLDSEDDDCSSTKHETIVPTAYRYHYLKTERLELITLVVFILAGFFMAIHVLCSRKKDKFRFEDERKDINYIRINRKH